MHNLRKTKKNRTTKMQIAPRPHCEQNNDFFKTVLNPSSMYQTTTQREKKIEPNVQRIVPLPSIESFSSFSNHFQRQAFKLPILKPLVSEIPHVHHETSFGWCCTFEGCNYQQKGRSDVFKAKRHVWDKHLRRTAEYNHPLENVSANSVAPIYEHLTQDDREKVKVSIFKYLKDQNLDSSSRSSNISKVISNSTSKVTKIAQMEKKITPAVLLAPMKQIETNNKVLKTQIQPKKVQEKKASEQPIKEDLLELEEAAVEELPKTTIVEKKNLCCTWKGCDYVQQEKDIWKAKRHIWDKHLRTSELYESLCSKNFAPSYGKLNQEEKKVLDGEIAKYIGEKVTSVSKITTKTKKSNLSSPNRNLTVSGTSTTTSTTSIKPKREKRKTNSSDALEEEQENAYRRKRTRNEDISTLKKRRVTRATAEILKVEFSKTVIPDLRPRPKRVPKDDVEKSGSEIWNPEMTNDNDIEELKKFCSIQMDIKTIDFFKVYNIFMQNEYKLIETQQFISSNLKSIEKEKMKRNFFILEQQEEEDLIQMKKLMEQE